MRNARSETGATLVLVIGVIAALGILAAALVALSASVMKNTSTTTMQVKSFNVAEAGLDSAQRALWASWPSSETVDTASMVDPTEFRTVFASDVFPDPKSGAFIEVEYFDDDGTPLPNPGIDRSVNWDANGNGILWIESRGAVAGRAAKIMACVQRVQYDLRIREGVALFSEGDLEVKGTGNQPVVGLDPPAQQAFVYLQGVLDMNSGATEDGIETEENTSVTLQDVFPAEILQNIIQSGKVFADWNAYTAWKTANPGVEPFATAPRIIVIENGSVDAKDFPETDTRADGRQTVWSEDDPGILVVLNGDLDSTGQKKTIYGIVYVVNGVMLRGNAEVHGMVIAKGWGDLRGTRAVNYNQNVISNLNKPVTLSVKLVPNTWRELQP